MRVISATTSFSSLFSVEHVGDVGDVAAVDIVFAGVSRLVRADVEAIEPPFKRLGLSVRGAGGEHTAAGAGGIVDISPSARLMVTEGEIARRLYQGVKTLWAEEKR